jgi:glucosamine-6-phosphate deaminase
MHKNLFNKININPENINLLNGEAKNPKKECENYEEKIKKNPIDLQLLGLGVNGHIGFNEPLAEKTSKTRFVELSQKTIKINKSKSTKALTMGIATIMNAKKIILLASGKNKAEAIKHLIEGKEDENWPVSFLRRHKNFVVLTDKEAGSLLHQ